MRQTSIDFLPIDLCRWVTVGLCRLFEKEINEGEETFRRALIQGEHTYRRHKDIVVHGSRTFTLGALRSIRQGSLTYVEMLDLHDYDWNQSVYSLECSGVFRKLVERRPITIDLKIMIFRESTDLVDWTHWIMWWTLMRLLDQNDPIKIVSCLHQDLIEGSPEVLDWLLESMVVATNVCDGTVTSTDQDVAAAAVGANITCGYE